MIVSVPTGIYNVRPASVAYAHYSWAAERLVRWCARDLYIPRPRIEWYVQPAAVSPSAERHPLRGYVNDDEPDVIYVRADQTELETLRSVGHEAYHQFEYAQGRSLDENRAEAYGRRVADAYLRGEAR